jgi:hypothetical protein
MQLSCLYHAVHAMRVTDDEEEYNRLLKTGEWFTHPSLESHHEEQIRQQSRKRSSNRRNQTKENGIGTRSEERICEEPGKKDSLNGRQEPNIES